MVDSAIAGIVGKRISGVVVKRGRAPDWQVLLLFDDGTYYEIYGSGSVMSCTGLDRGGIDEVRKYMAGRQQVVFEVLADGTTGEW